MPKHKTLEQTYDSCLADGLIRNIQSVNHEKIHSLAQNAQININSAEILAKFPEKIAFAKGASSGESSAKAATSGKASIPVANHGAASNAVKAGKAKAAVVKNWWWESNKKKFPRWCRRYSRWRFIK